MRHIAAENEMTIADAVIRRLVELKPELAKSYKVQEIALFGSLVRGEHDLESDVDVLVVVDESATLLDLARLELFLEATLHRKVDVVPKNDLREELRDRILAEAMPL